MKVGFFLVFRRDPQHYVLADAMVRSVRRTMPGAHVVQLTDERSPLLSGVDGAQRLPHGRMLERRIEHYAACEGDWLLLDTDVIVQRDVRDVFNQSFDVALTDRQWPHIEQSAKMIQQMPFNTGVVFSRCGAFWRAVREEWLHLPTEIQQNWMSEQVAVGAVATKHKDAFTVLTLPGMVYNFPPHGEYSGAQAAILHYKGQRKDHMREAACV